ncbi:VanZ family protein [Candidatus Acetothermia bacterium]|nr:VanZ family protein [Candidatus Acetothermia bacterium]
MNRNKIINRKTIWKPLLLVYAFALLVLALIPLDMERPLLAVEGGDKLVHFLQFFLFFLFAMRALPTRGLVAVLVLTASYGTVLELLQFVSPTRVISFTDWVANLGGGVGGLLAMGIFRCGKERRKEI